MNFFTFLLPLLWFQRCLTGSVRTHLKGLASRLEVDGPKVPPVLEGETKAAVTIGFLPGNIIEVDSAVQLLTVSGGFLLSWCDPDTAWNASEYGGITVTTVPTSKMWVPDVVLFNAVDNELITENIHKVTISNTGTVYAGSYSKYTFTCTLDVYDFPFDTQHCDLILRSSDNIVKLETTGLPFQFSEKSKIETEWEILGVSNCKSYMEDIALHHSCTLTITRQSSFYVSSIIFPMTLTSLMTSSVFLIPTESGEKVSFLVSIFISNAVFYNYISDLMPRASRTPPKMTVYLVIVLCHNFVLIFFTACELLYHYNVSSRVHDVALCQDQSGNRGPLRRIMKNLVLFAISVMVVVANTLFILL